MKRLWCFLVLLAFAASSASATYRKVRQVENPDDDCQCGWYASLEAGPIVHFLSSLQAPVNSTGDFFLKGRVGGILGENDRAWVWQVDLGYWDATVAGTGTGYLRVAPGLRYNTGPPRFQIYGYLDAGGAFDLRNFNTSFFDVPVGIGAEYYLDRSNKFFNIHLEVEANYLTNFSSSSQVLFFAGPGVTFPLPKLGSGGEE
ncbi:MAG TPA: hypothetical protein VMU88_09590 [bacterium]|nr:hypothetical protein [bacterium]